MGPGGQPTPPFKCIKHMHKGEVMFVCLYTSSLKVLKFSRNLGSPISIRSYSKVHMGTPLSCMFLIKKLSKKGDFLLILHFSFASEYTIRKVQENQV